MCVCIYIYIYTSIDEGGVSEIYGISPIDLGTPPLEIRNLIDFAALAERKDRPPRWRRRVRHAWSSCSRVSKRDDKRSLTFSLCSRLRCFCLLFASEDFELQHLFSLAVFLFDAKGESRAKGVRLKYMFLFFLLYVSFISYS